jgi:hypothetical protein
MKTRPSSILFAAAVVAALALPVQAGDVFTDAMQAAYVPYRAALFRTNAKAQAESEQALAEARVQFQALARRYGARAPVPYDRDPTFGATLAQVDQVLAEAEAQVRDRRLAQAHETLEAVRDLLGELRRRSGVVVYSDHMNAYHEVMEQVLTDGPKALTQPGGMVALAGQVGVLNYLARRLRSEAPATVIADPEFGPLVDAVLASVNGLSEAVMRQDEAAARSALAKVKSPYGRLFLKFG